MSRVKGLAEHVRKVTREIMAKNPNADVSELLARLCEHAEDVVALEQEQMARDDRSRGVGA